MTHQYFEVEEHLISPLKKFITRIEKERHSIVHEGTTSKINIFDSPMLNVVSLMKNRRNDPKNPKNYLNSLSK